MCEEQRPGCTAGIESGMPDRLSGVDSRCVLVVAVRGCWCRRGRVVAEEAQDVEGVEGDGAHLEVASAGSGHGKVDEMVADPASAAAVHCGTEDEVDHVAHVEARWGIAEVAAFPSMAAVGGGGGEVCGPEVAHV